MEDFQGAVIKTRNTVLGRQEYREATKALNRRVEEYNKAQQLSQKQATLEKDEEDLDR